jgi:hypothetical protein
LHNDASQEQQMTEAQVWGGAVGRRIWSGAESGAGTVLLRRSFALEAVPAAATLRLYADFRYQLWVNGVYVGRGPILRHPTELAVDTYEVGALLRPGRNALAVIVHTPGYATHYGIPTGHPGLCAALALPGGPLLTDGAWRACRDSGWSHDAPRRSWAIDRVERFTAEPALRGWQQPAFDDAHWPAAEVLPNFPAVVPGATWRERPLPQLAYTELPARLTGAFALRGPVPPLDAKRAGHSFATELMAENWQPLPAKRLTGRLDRDGVTLTPAAGEDAVVFVADLGAESVGQVIFEADFPGAGTVDCGWSEVLIGDKPEFCRKWACYVDRIVVPAAGPVRWEPLQMTGARHLALVCRGFQGPIRLRWFGLRASQPELPWHGRFHCSDEQLNAIWTACERTVRVGTQEGLMDCPTREQASYIGDGHPNARWLALLTGDLRYWRYLVYEQFRRPWPEGLIRSTLFSGSCGVLIDYDLLAIIGTRDYCRFAGDWQPARELLQPCRNILAWFERHCDARGFFALAWPAMRSAHTNEELYTPGPPPAPPSLNLFIDHPGMGWHNVGEPGVDRRGLNAAINALLIQARRALADLEEAAGDQVRALALRERAGTVAEVCRLRFTDASRGAFCDGVLDGARLPQLSEQTNGWALGAGWADPATARALLARLVGGDDRDVARGGPYFWTYLFPLLLEHGLADLALARTRQLWGRMVAGGATTLWETFTGDQLDTWCHPWSATPLEFLLTGVLGLPAGAGPWHLRPRYDLLPSAEGAVGTAHGPVTLAWRTVRGKVQLSGALPAGTTATLWAPTGAPLAEVSGDWRWPA